MGAVAVVVVGVGLPVDHIKPADDLAVVELLVSVVDAGVDHADAHAIAPKPEKIDGAVHSEVRPGTFEVCPDLEVFLDSEHPGAPCQALYLCRRHGGGEAADDVELAPDPEGTDGLLGREGIAGAGEPHDHIELVARASRGEFSLEVVREAVAIAVGKRRRRASRHLWRSGKRNRLRCQ